MNPTRPFRLLDHTEGNTVFDGTASREELAFGEEGALEVFFAGEFGEGDEGGVADVGEDVLGYAEGGMRERGVAEAGVGGVGGGGEVVGWHFLEVLCLVIDSRLIESLSPRKSHVLVVFSTENQQIFCFQAGERHHNEVSPFKALKLIFF